MFPFKASVTQAYTLATDLVVDEDATKIRNYIDQRNIVVNALPRTPACVQELEGFLPHSAAMAVAHGNLTDAVKGSLPSYVWQSVIDNPNAGGNGVPLLYRSSAAVFDYSMMTFALGTAHLTMASEVLVGLSGDGDNTLLWKTAASHCASAKGIFDFVRGTLAPQVAVITPLPSELSVPVLDALFLLADAQNAEATMRVGVSKKFSRRTLSKIAFYVASRYQAIADGIPTVLKKAGMLTESLFRFSTTKAHQLQSLGYRFMGEHEKASEQHGIAIGYLDESVRFCKMYCNEVPGVEESTGMLASVVTFLTTPTDTWVAALLPQLKAERESLIDLYAVFVKDNDLAYFQPVPPPGELPLPEITTVGTTTAYPIPDPIFTSVAFKESTSSCVLS